MKCFHITLKKNLPNIYKKGLIPMIGRRSDSVGEKTPILSFSSNLRAIEEWKKRLYPNISFDDLVILTFDIGDLEYVKRYDSYGDFFTTSNVASNKIKILGLNDIFGKKISLEKLQEIFMHNENKYKMEESSIKYNKNKTTEEERKQLIEDLASYEHEKWSQIQDSIFWTSKNLTDGSKIISKEKIEDILKNNNLSYSQTSNLYRKEIKKRIKETFYLIIESTLFDELEISEEELKNILEIVEHNRNCRWFNYLLSECSIIKGEYVIPNEKVKLWETEIQTLYVELSENKKQSDREEVYNIFNAINEYKIEKLEIDFKK